MTNLTNLPKFGSSSRGPPCRALGPTLTSREVAELSDACGAQGDVVLILAYRGLRFGELTGLNVEAVDVDARRIRVRRSPHRRVGFRDPEWAIVAKSPLNCRN